MHQGLYFIALESDRTRVYPIGGRRVVENEDAGQVWCNCHQVLCVAVTVHRTVLV